MESSMNYLDFAEDDYKYLKEDFDHGRVANYMASMASNTAERYLKHVIDLYSEPENDKEMAVKNEILHSHNLEKLMRHIENHTDMKFSADEKQAIRGINGYYFSTRYPGDDCMSVDKEIIERCVSVTGMCREKVTEYCQEKEELEEKAGPLQGEPAQKPPINED